MNQQALVAATRALTGLIVASGLAAVVCSCADPESSPNHPQHFSKPRLVILYAPCTVNKDYLAPYNSDIPFTPNLKQFAKRAVVFTKHQTESGQSGIAYASILTGNQAHRHGVYRHPVELPDDAYLIFEAYAEHGYETFFWNGHLMAGSELNYGQGVRPNNTFRERVMHADDPSFVKILERLQSDKNYRAFVFTNFSVTHFPYDTTYVQPFCYRYPDQAEGISEQEIAHFSNVYRQNRRPLSMEFSKTIERLALSESEEAKLARVVELLYKTNVWMLDRIFGELVAKIESYELRDQSLIVFTADHGEVLDRYNTPAIWGHAMMLASEVLNVPLLISTPGLEASTYDRVTRSVDLFPTMLGLCGKQVSSHQIVQGVDLSAAMMDQQLAPDLIAYSHTSVLVHMVFEQMYEAEHMQDLEGLRTSFPSEDVNLIWVCVRDGCTVWKLRNLDGHNWGIEAFDLAHDPGENENLYDSNNHEHAQMAEKLRVYKNLLVKRYEDTQSEESKRSLSQQEEIDALRSLGYIN